MKAPAAARESDATNGNAGRRDGRGIGLNAPGPGVTIVQRQPAPQVTREPRELEAESLASALTARPADPPEGEADPFADGALPSKGPDGPGRATVAQSFHSTTLSDPRSGQTEGPVNAVSRPAAFSFASGNSRTSDDRAEPTDTARFSAPPQAIVARSALEARSRHRHPSLPAPPALHPNPGAGALHPPINNQVVNQPVQRQTAIDTAADSHEQQADQATIPIMRGGATSLRAKGAVIAQPLRRCTSCGLQNLQRKCAACEDEEARSVRIQAKLALGSVGDRYEVEADRVAEALDETPAAPRATPIETGLGGVEAGIISPARDRMISPVAGNALAPVDGESDTLDAVERRLPGLESGGAPLPEATRWRMQQHFGVDFSDVRVHHNAEAARLNEALDARAFTHDRHIFFAAGAFGPGTTAGDRLLAHELTHVVQQTGGSSGAGAAIQRYEEPKIRGDLFHGEIESRFRKKNPNLITESKIPGGTTNKREFDAVGRPDFYESSPAGVLPGVRGDYGKDDPDKRTLTYHKLVQDRASSTGGTKTSPNAGVGTGFVGAFPNILVGDLKPLAIDKFLQGKLHIGPKMGEGMAQIGNYKSGYEAFTAQATKDGIVASPATAGTLTTLQVPAGLDYRNFAAESVAASPGEGAVIAGAKKARYWIMPMPDWGLYAYFTLPHPFNASAYKAAVDKVFAELKKFTATLRQNKKTAAPKLDLKRRNPGAAPLRTSRIQRKPDQKTNWTAVGAEWERQRAAWDDGYAKAFLRKEGSEMGEKVAIDAVLGEHGPFKTEAPRQTQEFHSVELWSGMSGKLLVKGRTLLGGTFDKIIDFYESVRKRFAGFHKKMQATSSSGYGWMAKIKTVIVAALKLGFKELLTAVYRIFSGCFNGVVEKVIGSFTDEIKDATAEELKELHQLFDSFHDRVKAEFEARFGNWDELIAALQSGQKIVGLILNMVQLIRVIIQLISCLTPPAAGCVWGIVANLAGEVALNLGIPLILNSSQFRDQVLQPVIQDLVKDFAGEEIQGVIDTALGAVNLGEYSKSVTECQIKGAAKPVKELLGPLPNIPGDPDLKLMNPTELAAHRDKWQSDHRTELASQIAPYLTTASGAGASSSDVLDLFNVIERRKPDHDQLRAAFEAARNPNTNKFDLNGVRNRITGVPPGLFASPPSIKAQVQPPRGGITFGSGSPLPGAKEGDTRSGPTITIPLP